MITGFCNVKTKNKDEFLKSINEEKSVDLDIQIFDAGIIATWQHLYFAALNALTAFKNNENFSKTLAMETMIYASTQRQIRKATEILGIKPNSTSMAILIIGDKPEKMKLALSRVSKKVNGKLDEEVLELTDEKMANIQKIFRISDEELEVIEKESNKKEALINMVVEHIALVATER
jgi:tRNA threonylcarbamoyladenosine modification (KEOPS) complex Cgi121 subunit